MAGPSKVVFGNEVIIDLTSDTVAENKMLYGYTAHDRKGDIIIGSCTFDSDTTDANATTDEILSGKTAYVNKVKLTGSMTNRGAISETIDDKDDVISVPAGFHDGSGTVSIDSTEKSKIIAENIKSGIEILGTTGNYSGEPVSVTSKTVTPYTTSQTVLPGTGYDYLSQVTVNAISKVETQNPAGGITVTIGDVAPSS